MGCRQDGVTSHAAKQTCMDPSTSSTSPLNNVLAKQRETTTASQYGHRHSLRQGCVTVNGTTFSWAVLILSILTINLSRSASSGSLLARLYQRLCTCLALRRFSHMSARQLQLKGFVRKSITGFSKYTKKIATMKGTRISIKYTKMNPTARVACGTKSKNKKSSRNNIRHRGETKIQQ